MFPRLAGDVADRPRALALRTGYGNLLKITSSAM
jgi:hypothetical protein